MFRRAIAFFTDILFPLFCIECGVEGSKWCTACIKKSSRESIIFSPAPTAELAAPPLETIVAFFNYHDAAPIGKFIRELKYSFAWDARSVLNDLVSDAPASLTAAQPLVIPVPLHPRRLRERGFNQAELVARAVVERYGLTIDTRSLVRARYTSQQAKLNREDREKNMRAAFVWQGAALPPTNIVLVDDVYTTGATMLECAKALQAAGAQHISALVLARG